MAGRVPLSYGRGYGLSSDWEQRPNYPPYPIEAPTDFLQPHEAEIDGAQGRKEYRIPTDELEELEEFNSNLVGNIEMIAEFHAA